MRGARVALVYTSSAASNDENFGMSVFFFRERLIPCRFMCSMIVL